MKIKNKISIITGGSRGIGKAIAKKFAEEGAIVVLAARSKTELENALVEIKEFSKESMAISVDISNKRDVKRLVDNIITRFSKIDILVNNAAILSPIGPIEKIDTIEWENTIKINLFGTFYCMKETIPHMIAQRQGKILNLSGGGAFNPFPNFSAYSTSKSAIVRLTETVAEELKQYDIQVNAISPGAIKTQMTNYVIQNKDLAGNEYLKAKEVMEEGGSSLEKVKDLALFLVSDESNGLTGRTISAQWDDLEFIRKNIDSILKSDKFTMKRIV